MNKTEREQKEYLKEECLIVKDPSTHGRGWLICDPNLCLYLHKDGAIEYGCRNSEDAFWPSQIKAMTFYVIFCESK